MSETILAVDDDAETLGLISRALARAGMQVACADGVAAARRLLGERSFDVLVLDVMLGDGSGLALCRALRSAGDLTPILFLSARGAVRARVDGLEAGGDDYLAKPFAVIELVARVRALGRRGAGPRARVLRVGAAAIDFDARRVTVAEREVPVTAREWDVLRVLAQADGKVVAFDDILASAWGEVADGGKQSLEVIVSRLRRKLAGPDGQCPLRTARGVGYALDRA
ncbi:MAG: response regulator transcription factor [Myxococcota bacterium]